MKSVSCEGGCHWPITGYALEKASAKLLNTFYFILNLYLFILKNIFIFLVSCGRAEGETMI